MRTFSLYLDKKAYNPGDKVRGFVYVKLNKAVEIRNISLHVQGTEKVKIGNGEDAIISTHKLMSRVVSV